MHFPTWEPPTRGLQDKSEGWRGDSWNMKRRTKTCYATQYYFTFLDVWLVLCKKLCNLAPILGNILTVLLQLQLINSSEMLS